MGSLLPVVLDGMCGCAVGVPLVRSDVLADATPRADDVGVVMVDLVSGRVELVLLLQLACAVHDAEVCVHEAGLFWFVARRYPRQDDA